MIAKVKCISHGINCLRYITGESNNKKHPEKIYLIKNYLLDSAMDATSIYDKFDSACTAKSAKIKDKVIRIELSPSKEYTEGFTSDDWRRLWDDFIHEFDKIEIRNRKTDELISEKTDLANTMGTVWLHQESRSGIPHLHGAYCRVDKYGRTNNDHRIEVRAKLAAERVALRRGWITAQSIHDSNVEQIKTDCISLLHKMDRWDWDLYAKGLQQKGYSVNFRKNHNGKIVGYSIRKGNAIYHASKLRTNRLTAAHIKNTWINIHREIAVQEEVKQLIFQASRLGNDISKQEHPKTTSLVRDYSIPRPDSVSYSIFNNGKDLTLFIPQEVDDYFKDEFDERTISNSLELCNLAVAAFAQLLIPSVSESSVGGGNSNDLPWRDKDDDDLMWARRCAMYAKQKLGVQPKRRWRR